MDFPPHTPGNVLNAKNFVFGYAFPIDRVGQMGDTLSRLRVLQRPTACRCWAAVRDELPGAQKVAGQWAAPEAQRTTEINFRGHLDPAVYTHSLARIP